MKLKLLSFLASALFLAACQSNSATESNKSLLSAATEASATVKLVPGEEYFSELTSLLSEPLEADTSIDVMQFNFFTDTPGHVRDIGNQLKAIKAAHPDVRIRLALEGEKDKDKPDGKGAAQRNQKTVAFFAGSGVEIHMIYGLRAAAIKGVTHAKAVRVGNKLLSGSTNLTNTSLDKNNEFNVLVDSKKISKAFENYLNDVIQNPGMLNPLSAVSGKVTMLTDTLYYDEALKFIKSAKNGENLDLTTYFFAAFRKGNDGEDLPGDEKANTVFKALVAAQERGVNVRVFLERAEVRPGSNLNGDITKSNLNIARLFQEAGLTSVYFDKTDKISHAKIIKVSGDRRAEALLGSTNIYRGDLEENHQVNFLLKDPDVVHAITPWIDAKIQDEGTEFGQIGQ